MRPQPTKDYRVQKPIRTLDGFRPAECQAGQLPLHVLFMINTWTAQVSADSTSRHAKYDFD